MTLPISLPVAVFAAATAFMAASCGVVHFEANTDEGQTNKTTTTAAVDGTADPGDLTQGATAVTAGPGRTAVVAVPVDDLEAIVEGNRIVAQPVWTGVDPCHGLERVDVTSAGDGVFTLTVWEGLDPGVDPAAPQCQGMASQRTTQVDLGPQPSGIYAVTGAVTEDGGGEGAGTTVEVEVP